jgi:large subunit ribosomal protein L24
MYKLRKGDTVQVTKGKDSGKKGKIINVLDEGTRVLVEGINLVKKHKRQTRQDQQGGIVSIERPLSTANLMYVCKACSRAARIGFRIQNDKTKVRFCKSCNEAV